MNPIHLGSQDHQIVQTTTIQRMKKMITEIDWSAEELKILLGWYQRLFGKNKRTKPTPDDIDVYDKMKVVHKQIKKEEKEQKDLFSDDE